MMLNNQEFAANAIIEAREFLKKKQYEQALAACSRALEADPNAYGAYTIRWQILAETMAPDETRAKIEAEVEAFLNAQKEIPEVLNTAYWGYMELTGRTKNVPEILFAKMLQYPKTRASLSALCGLAERSNNPREKWDYNQRLINEFTAEDVPELSWYMIAHINMLRLAEQDRSLATDESLDELIDRYLQAHLAYCRHSKQWFGWAYTEAVKWRLKFGIKLGKALETLERAEVRLKEKEEQEWIERAGENLKESQSRFMRLRGEISLKQERWKEAYDAIAGTAPPYLTSLWHRFGEETIHHFWMLGRASEGLGQFDRATQYYTDAHFVPKPHPEARAGLERVYQTQHGSLKRFEVFLKEAESEYRKREAADLEAIRQNLITEKRNQEAKDLTLETLEGKTFTLSAMWGKVVLLDVWASWCGPCIRAISEVAKVYEHFSAVEDVVIWGVNSGEHPEKVRAFLAEHQLPWLILLDPNREVSSAYNIESIPSFILIDKNGCWHKLTGYHQWLGQELIWLIEALQSTDENE